VSRRPYWMPFVIAGLGFFALERLMRRVRLDAQENYFFGRVVVITGASRGIGQALAHAFAAQGARVVLAARTVNELEDVAAECRFYNPALDPLIVPTDVADESQLTRLVDQTLDHFGRIDILVNNAGIRQGGSFAALPPQSVEQQIEVNLLAAIHLTRLVLPTMLERGSGHIVNMGSAAGRHTEPYFVGYGTSKHGLAGFSEGLRRELAPRGIHVMLVSPGFTDTAMVDEIGPVYRRMGFPMIPVERVARRTLEGILLRRPEVDLGGLETVGGYVSKLFPALADQYWKTFMPRDFPVAARRQYSD
jgi:short-subunit dehydrogenase